MVRKNVKLTSNKNSLININKSADLANLTNFNQAVKEMQKTYATIFNNESFKQLASKFIKTDQVVKDIMKTYDPIIKQAEKQHKLIKALNISILTPQEIVIPRKNDKKYSEDEVRRIVEEAVGYTLKLTNNQNTNTFPHKLKKDYQWENITIKFKDGHNVQILTNEHIYVANYKEMGFEDSRKLAPNQQWIFLETLSKLKGRISWNDNKANNTIKKKKQLLADTLKQYFDINYDPFYPYKKEKAYQLKLNIIPEAESINQELIKNDDLGIEDSYKEITKQ